MKLSQNPHPLSQVVRTETSRKTATPKKKVSYQHSPQNYFSVNKTEETVIEPIKKRLRTESSELMPKIKELGFLSSRKAPEVIIMEGRSLSKTDVFQIKKYYDELSGH